MTKLLSYLLIAVALVSCNGQSGYEITGTVANLDLNGKYIFMYPYGIKNASPIDSALVENRTFTFKGIQDCAVFRELCFDIYDVPLQRVPAGEDSPFTVLFILENSKFKATLGELSFVTGTPENDAWTELRKEIKRIRKYRKTIIENSYSTDSLIAAEAERQHEEMEGQIIRSVEKYILQNPNKLSTAKLLTAFNLSLSDSVKGIALTKGDDQFRAVPGIENMIERQMILDKVMTGKPFADFELNDPQGVKHNLSEYAGKGKVVLIDFWASWCGPCRADMPRLQEIYNSYKDKGLEIVGVSLDRSEKLWIEGIRELNITWPQLSDLQHWDNKAATLYGVEAIPFTVLIDKDGTIIAKNLRGKALDAKLAEILN
ncbi:thiol-disulfide isomerase/thioredoxin [Parabacteroides sp. PF5-5]|uniref:AhpC/TSA family protein n=1 Tax=unclassified Parabacteroides TaxID=2649774 RepID=UPI0024755534|nr:MULTISPECIES: AhpC/TSA family protein [unclassified Parabacteroides]MDH6304322.1 thiol-disulfide isomerase/thioredoxin [Parabacteroides sp. PH5-39]MDH6315525.1 thiol-disulfide isomerase/thioredoxin [Parabacteroides sp. PF5-13]MDH6318981.1 thiol-disulfide isomerase/thioredoxin [Parabacteroides sp. PH5-13]MDH6322710.1 thiol-disulfide isomerase/thioredoxin [Parabacteroides sp. PH5-8]MDH6326718.1 thiol-disulfide isomerase/thioredoxin [Parabacteroides sp. PH5-41]